MRKLPQSRPELLALSSIALQGNKSTALLYFQRAALRFFEEGNTPLALTSVGLMCTILTEMNFPEKAIPCLQKAISMAKSQDDSEISGDLLIRLSHVQLQSQRWDEVIITCSQALDGLLQAMNQQQLMLEAMKNMAQAYEEIGDKHNATKYHRQVEDIANQLADMPDTLPRLTSVSFQVNETDALMSTSEFLEQMDSYVEKLNTSTNISPTTEIPPMDELEGIEEESSMVIIKKREESPTSNQEESMEGDMELESTTGEAPPQAEVGQGEAIEDLLPRAEGLLQQGFYGEAIKAAEAILLLDEKHERSHKIIHIAGELRIILRRLIQRANTLEQQNKLHASLAEWEKVLDMTPSHPKVLEKVEVIRKKLDQHVSVSLEKLAEFSEGCNFRMVLVKGQELLKIAPDHPQCQELIQQAKDKLIEAEDLFQKAQRLFNDGNMNKAAEYAKKVLALDPKKAAAQEILDFFKQPHKVNEELSKKRKEANKLMETGQNLLDVGHYEYAIKIAQEALTLDPGRSDALDVIRMAEARGNIRNPENEETTVIDLEDLQEELDREIAKDAEDFSKARSTGTKGKKKDIAEEISSLEEALDSAPATVRRESPSSRPIKAYEHDVIASENEEEALEFEEAQFTRILMKRKQTEIRYRKEEPSEEDNPTEVRLKEGVGDDSHPEEDKHTEVRLNEELSELDDSEEEKHTEVRLKEDVEDLGPPPKKPTSVRGPSPGLSNIKQTRKQLRSFFEEMEDLTENENESS